MLYSRRNQYCLVARSTDLIISSILVGQYSAIVLLLVLAAKHAAHWHALGACLCALLYCICTYLNQLINESQSLHVSLYTYSIY